MTDTAALDHEDPVRGSTSPSRCWTTTNAGEASPLVLTALEWALWGQAVELGARGAWSDFGFLPRSEVRASAMPDERITACFYGRQAINVDLTREIMGMIPGSTADDFERDMLGSVRPDATPVPNSLRRVPFILAKAPRVLATQRRAVQELHEQTLTWWHEAVLDGPATDPHALLRDASDRFTRAMRVHVRSRTLLQGMQAQATALCTAAGHAELAPALLSGYGGVTETAIAEDVWRLGRGELTLAAFVRGHGFHGPNEGNPRSRSWREDPSAVEALARASAQRDATTSPALREEAAAARRQEAEATVLAALPRARRSVARAVFRGAGQQVRNLELGKAAFVMAIDGTRRAAREIGQQLVLSGRLEDAEQVFHLLPEELTGGGDLREVAAARYARHLSYEGLRLPVTFIGMPVALEDAAVGGASTDLITGSAGAPGRVTGRVRVVLDPDAGDALEEGEVMVCSMTDPGWAPLFSLAAGLVIDVGGPSSHGAIVARELGLPCVIGTGIGTTALQTGDEVAVDGSAGTVEVLRRA